ncbi:MAG: glycosyltransferase family 4 protein [Thermoplasmata archaeon]|nr:glycosyltransferase family 4 protein [Thermoplasmata archaeon]
MLPWTSHIKNMDVKKVVLITNMFPPFPEGVIDLSGGSDVASEIFVDELNEIGIQTNVISLDYVKKLPKEKKHIIRIGNYFPYVMMEDRLSTATFVYRESFRPLIFLRIIGHLKRIKPDIIVIGKTYQLSLAPMIAARFLRIPYIVRYDWLCPTNPKPELCTLKDRLNCAQCIEEISKQPIPKIGKILSGFFFVPMSMLKGYLWNRAEGALAVSEFHKQLMISFGIRDDFIEILPNVMSLDSDLDVIQELKEKYDTKDHFTILYVGRLEPEKGIEILMEAFDIVKKEHDKIKLLIAGSGRLSELAKDKSAKDPKMTFLGRVPHEELGNYYSICDIVAIPSIVPEGHPIVAEEAMSLGKIIIGFDMGGLEGIFRERSEHIAVKEISAEGLAEGIINHINNYADPGGT